MRFDVLHVGTMGIRGNLDVPLNAARDVPDEIFTGVPILTSNVESNDKLCVAVDASPKPEIAPASLWLPHPKAVDADIRPRFIKRQPIHPQIAEIVVM
jgi:hypothetical protein